MNSANEHILRRGNKMTVAMLYRPISRFYKRKMRDVLFKICLSNKTNNAFTTDITTKDFCFADNYDVQ